VAQQPQRPYVPHRTPNKPRPAIAAAEFRLSKPFVPGAERSASTAIEIVHVGGDASVEQETLRGIDEFLERETAATAYGTVSAPGESRESYLDEPDELPPVEHFLDPIPAVGEFSADDFAAYGGPDPATESAASVDQVTTAQTDWLETDWQNYDWRAAAALGETGVSEASTAWSTTDWDASAPQPRTARPSAAHAIAKALDEIARRIRDGELAVPAPSAATDPATIAATLAALLGIRQ
jgi:hypothetical protein